MHTSHAYSLLTAAGALQRLYRSILHGVQQPRQPQQEESGSAAAQGAPSTSSAATTVIVDNLSVGHQCTRQYLALAPCLHSTVYWAQSFLFGCLPSCFASCIVSLSLCKTSELLPCCPAAWQALAALGCPEREWLRFLQLLTALGRHTMQVGSLTFNSGGLRVCGEGAQYQAFVKSKEKTKGVQEMCQQR